MSSSASSASLASSAAGDASTEASNLDVRIHPLVVMSVADHYTRSLAQYNKRRVIGGLFGVQSGRQVHVYDTFEIGFREENNTVLIEEKAFEEDLKLFKEAYPHYECLGWYSSGEDTRPADKHIQEQMSKFNERPLFLLMNPNVAPDAKELPLTLFEEDVRVVDDKTITEFVRSPFRITADEAERISAVHCSQVVVEDGGGAAVSPHLLSVRRAVKMLNERIRVLVSFLKDASQGKVEADHATLRAIKGICNRLPAMDSSTFAHDFMSEHNDALLVAYLAGITKSAEEYSRVVDRFNETYMIGRRAGRGGRGRGGDAHPGLGGLLSVFGGGGGRSMRLGL